MLNGLMVHTGNMNGERNQRFSPVLKGKSSEPNLHDFGFKVSMLLTSQVCRCLMQSWANIRTVGFL